MTLGFIGIGHIATAVIEGLYQSKPDNLRIHLSPRGKKNSIRLAETYPSVYRLKNNQQVVNQSDIIFIAVRPSDAGPVLTELSFSEDQTVVSFVPFLQQEDFTKAVGPAQKVCRAIPLPTVIYHTCPIPLFNATDEIINLFNRIGQPLQVTNEKQLHALWTLTGFITPFYDILDELSTWAESEGVDKPVANQYLADLFQSLSFAAQQSDPINFEKLSNHAATPNGMNEQAGEELKKQGTLQTYTKIADRLLEQFQQNL
jgi:pyrroline-5-carboxylate reductase